MKKNPLKPIPQLDSDEAAERFVDKENLTEYDLSGFKPTHFEVKEERVKEDLHHGKTYAELMEESRQLDAEVKKAIEIMEQTQPFWLEKALTKWLYKR